MTGFISFILMVAGFFILYVLLSLDEKKMRGTTIGKWLEKHFGGDDHFDSDSKWT